ncbi:ubiquitin-specific protease ubp15 [Elasticomyces elasticus]|nr:ubiquitin-specific protease ubp15 [Elasticomyces elasticus]
MLVDGDYDEKLRDVAIISPDDNMEGTENIRADDFEAMKAHHMPELPGLEQEAETIHTWDIEDWTKLPRRTHGPLFQCGGHPWRVLFFPSGNNANESVSFYLEQGFGEDKPPEDWYACVQFMLVLWNPHDPTIYVQHVASHRFTQEEGDWGFTRFSEKTKIFHTNQFEGKERPLVENGAAKMTAYVRVMKDPTGVLWHNFVNYDSKRETGLVGLKNQGATCYLNSLLQSLYFTTAFRKAIYQIPTENEDDRTTSAYALQKLFYKLQADSSAVSTQELTQSFGWDSRQIFEQQDVQELSRILMDRMEERMKGTEAERALPEMFVGQMKTYLKCINVQYESSRLEDFWDLQLNVQGCKTLDDSFKAYIAVETLEGDNKYAAEGFGLQDAAKGVIFESFPQVLHLQLKRFEYDFQRDTMMKVNDRYEFPEVWDASPYLSETADRSEPYIYHLHGVLVHSGDLNAGHYYSFLKPQKNGDFFKFDDDRVTRATKREAMDENFGGDYATNGVNGHTKGGQNPYTRTWSSKRSMSAYMLVYIRESRLDSILLGEEAAKPPSYLPTRIIEERALIERRRREREEAHLYMRVATASMTEFRRHQGFDILPWNSTREEDPAAPALHRLLKTMKLSELTAKMAHEMETDADLLRPWVVVNRQNSTIRPEQPLVFGEMSIEDAFTKFATKTGFRIFMEQATGRDDEGVAKFSPPYPANAAPNSKPVLIFLKYFDVEAQTLHGFDHIYIPQSDKVQDLIPPILQLMGWPEGTKVALYEEIKSDFIDPMKYKTTLAVSEIQDGDIVCFQKALSPEEQAAIQQKSPTAYLGAPAFYDYMLNRCVVHFALRAPLPADIDIPPDQANFELWLSRKDTYEGISMKVAEHLSKLGGIDVDPTHLRFHSVSSQTNKPRAVVKRVGNPLLASILQGSNYGNGYPNAQMTDSLFYEVLEMSLTDYEQRKPIKIAWLSEGITKEDIFDQLMVPKQGTIHDVIPLLQKRASLPDEVIEQIRFYDIHSGKVNRVLKLDHPVLGLNDYSQIYAERIPEDQRDPVKMNENGDVLLDCFHFDKDPGKPYGVPFIFTLRDGEIFKDTKERLSQRTGIKGKQFEKIRFAAINGTGFAAKAVYLEDGMVNPHVSLLLVIKPLLTIHATDDILSEKLDSAGMLGLDHPNKARNLWNRHETLNIR